MEKIEKIERIRFADNLRGLAAVLVVLSHLAGVFWLRPDVVHSLLQVSPAHTTHPELLALVKALHFHPLVDYGELGVSLFFLISGFVIPFSLCRESRGQFAVIRAVRIYPTYWCALAITLAALWLAGCFLGGGSAVAPGRVILQALLLRDWCWLPGLDAVSWSLEMEIKFYLLIMIAAGWLGRGRWLPLLLFVSGLGLVSLLARDGDTSGTIKWPLVLQYDLPIIVYMFIGTMFNLLYRKKIGGATAAAGILYLYLLVLLTAGQSAVLGGFFGQFALNYSVSLAVFAACYRYRDAAPKNRILDFLARISYPLYAVHAVTGFVLLEYFLTKGINAFLALTLTFAAVIILAWLLHRLVEKPTVRLGHRLAGNR